MLGMEVLKANCNKRWRKEHILNFLLLLPFHLFHFLTFAWRKKTSLFKIWWTIFLQEIGISLKTASMAGHGLGKRKETLWCQHWFFPSLSQWWEILPWMQMNWACLTRVPKGISVGTYHVPEEDLNQNRFLCCDFCTGKILRMPIRPGILIGLKGDVIWILKDSEHGTASSGVHKIPLIQTLMYCWLCLTKKKKVHFLLNKKMHIQILRLIWKVTHFIKY